MGQRVPCRRARPWAQLRRCVEVGEDLGRQVGVCRLNPRVAHVDLCPPDLLRIEKTRSTTDHNNFIYLSNSTLVYSGPNGRSYCSREMNLSRLPMPALTNSTQLIARSSFALLRIRVGLATSFSLLGANGISIVRSCEFIGIVSGVQHRASLDLIGKVGGVEHRTSLDSLERLFGE